MSTKVDYEIAKERVTQARPEKGQMKSRLDRMQEHLREAALISMIQQKKIFTFNYIGGSDQWGCPQPGKNCYRLRESTIFHRLKINFGCHCMQRADMRHVKPMVQFLVQTFQAKLNLTVVRDLPMTETETEQFQVRLARATISAGLPERWIEDPEVIKVFRMLRTAVSLTNRRKIRASLLQTLLVVVESPTNAAI